MSDMIRKSDALAAAQDAADNSDEPQDVVSAIAALPAVTVGVKPLVWSQTYNNAGDLTDVWCADDPLFEHRWWAERADKIPKIEAKRTARILAALEPVTAPDPAAIHDALLSLPAVYAHQINTGVREVYDPLQRFYRMEDVLSALAAHVNEPPKGKHDAGNVLTPDPAAIREAALMEAHDEIADYPRVAPDGAEAQHYDEQIEHSQAIILALIQKGAAEPTEYERKAAQMKKDFPNGI